MPWLVRLGPTGNSIQSWELGKDPLVFGREDDLPGHIDDQQMSRRHFNITFVNGSHILTDQGSTNGTWVNGRRVSNSYLKENDQIHTGQTRFLYQVGTSTFFGQAEKAVGGSFQDELKKIYGAADSKRG